jgi:hypothetical protein
MADGIARKYTASELYLTQGAALTVTKGRVLSLQQAVAEHSEQATPWCTKHQHPMIANSPWTCAQGPGDVDLSAYSEEELEDMDDAVTWCELGWVVIVEVNAPVEHG